MSTVLVRQEVEDPRGPSPKTFLWVGLSFFVAGTVLMLLMIFIPSRQDEFLVAGWSSMLFSIISLALGYHHFVQAPSAAAPPPLPNTSASANNAIAEELLKKAAEDAQTIVTEVVHTTFEADTGE